MEQVRSALVAVEPEQQDGPPAERPPRFALPAGRLRLVAVAIVAIIVVALLVVRPWSAADPPPITGTDVNRAVQQGIEKAQQEQREAPPDGALAYRKIEPSMVTITARAGAGTSLGAGVVVNANGAVLTALHVVEGGGAIQVRFADGTRAGARVTARQPANDIAVLGVDRLPGVVVPAVLGGSARIGDTVFPVGDPLGLTRSLSGGVVSGTGRSISTPDGRSLRGLIQFDAAVNPGNSGGPLLDRDGRVVGVVTGLANPAKQPYFVGIGFAVPIATAGGAAGSPPK